MPYTNAEILVMAPQHPDDLADRREPEVSTDAASATIPSVIEEYTHDSEPAGTDLLAGVAPPKPADSSSEATDAAETESAREISALNAPAEVSPCRRADQIDAATDGELLFQQLRDDFPNDATPAPVDTPLIAQPLPHSDDFQPGTIAGPQEGHLVAYAASQLEDAGLLLDDDEHVGDPWSLDDDDADDDDADVAEAANSARQDDLAALDNFAGNRAEAEQLEHDIPLQESFLNPRAGPAEATQLNIQQEGEPSDTASPDFDDFADFSSIERVQQSQQPAWEPFEEPSGHPESTPPSADGYDRRAERDRDGFSAEPSEVPEVLRRSSVEDVEFDAVRTRDNHREAEVSPSTSAEGSGVMVREADMSSPELVDQNGEWEQQPRPAAPGAEILEVRDESVETIQAAERESVVQHEELRPAPHDESAVQHESERLIVADDVVIQPGVVLPAQDVHPQQRTFTPPVDAVPEGEAGDEWNLDHDDVDVGADLLAEPTYEAELAPPPIPDESTVQHISERSTVDNALPAQETLPAAIVQPQEHTFSPSSAALPDPSRNSSRSDAVDTLEAPATALSEGDEGVEWDFADGELATGADILGEPAFETELAPSPVPDESTVQHIIERPTVGDPVAAQEALPASSVQPQEHTFAPSLSALTATPPQKRAGHAPASRDSAPAAGDAGADWNLEDKDAGTGADGLAEPDFVPSSVPEESAVQHVSQPASPVDSETTKEPLPVSTVHPQEHTFTPSISALPATSPQEQHSGSAEAPVAIRPDQAPPSPPFSGAGDFTRLSESTQDALDSDGTRPSIKHATDHADPPSQVSGGSGEAEFDDPWDLDPLAPEASVADFAGTLSKARGDAECF